MTTAASPTIARWRRRTLGPAPNGAAVEPPTPAEAEPGRAGRSSRARRVPLPTRLPGLPSLWFGVLAAPLAWGAQLLVNYTLVYIVGDDHAFVLDLVSLAAILIAVAGLVVAWKSHRRRPTEAEEDAAGEPAIALLRSDFMAYAGVLFGLLSLLLILLSGVTPFVLSPTDY